MPSQIVTPEELASILRNVGDGITAQGPDGALVYANDAAARLCGLESAEQTHRDLMTKGGLLK